MIENVHLGYIHPLNNVINTKIFDANSQHYRLILTLNFYFELKVID